MAPATMTTTIESYPSFLKRISMRKNQVISMDNNREQELEDLDLFQKHVSDRFSNLLSPIQDSPILSITWLRKLMDVFLACEAEFKAVLFLRPSHLSKPTLDRLIPEFLDRSVKVLDLCNAVSSAVESVRRYQRLAEIAVAAMKQRPICDGQVKRAKKALISLSALIASDDGRENYVKTTERARSFGRRRNNNSAAVTLRSLSMVVARNWSAAKQINAMSSNLVAPLGGESGGVALSVYIMSVVMVHVMWASVAAVPCQERNGLALNMLVPRHLLCSGSVMELQEKVGKEWKKKEKTGSIGLMVEVRRMERLTRSLIEFADGFCYPEEEVKVEEVACWVAEMEEICGRMEGNLGALQQQIRDVFHRVVRSRNEVLELLERSGKIM